MTNKIKIENTSDSQIAVGGVLNTEQQEALHGISPTADDILNNMNDFNEEIEDTYGEFIEEQSSEVKSIPEVQVPKPSRKRRGAKKYDQKNRIAKNKKETPMNLDQELDKINEEFDTRAETNTTDTVNNNDVPMTGDMRFQILDLLRNTKDAPGEQQIQQWKLQYGANGVHVMALGEGDVYVFTHLKRGQWKKIQETMAKIQDTGASKDLEDELKEKVIQYCVIWPKLSLEFFYNSRAGVCDSLYQVILLNSYFLSPQQAMLLTTQL